MSASTLTRKANPSTSRAAVRRLLAHWQELNARQHSLFDEMQAVESRLSEHINLRQYTELGGVRGSYADCVLDTNERPDDTAEWLGQAIAAAGL